SPMLQASWVPRPVQWAADQLSFERKVGRAGDARRRVEFAAAQAPKQMLDEATGNAMAANKVLSRLPAKLRSGLSRGEQKAIQVLSWDDPNPLEAERRFHQQAVELGVGAARAHEQQLADLALAER